MHVRHAILVGRPRECLTYCLNTQFVKAFVRSDVVSFSIKGISVSFIKMPMLSDLGREMCFALNQMELLIRGCDFNQGLTTMLINFQTTSTVKHANGILVIYSEILLPFDPTEGPKTCCFLHKTRKF